jgi:hypothetical protein
MLFIWRKLETATINKDNRKTPKMQAIMHIILPSLVFGEKSPYPTVHMVIVTSHIEFQYLSKLAPDEYSDIPLSNILTANANTPIENKKPVSIVITGLVFIRDLIENIKLVLK